MCFSFWWFLSSLDCIITPSLLQNNTKGDAIRGTTLSLVKNFQSQMTSFVALEAATYSAFIVESAMQGRFSISLFNTFNATTSIHLMDDETRDLIIIKSTI